MDKFISVIGREKIEEIIKENFSTSDKKDSCLIDNGFTADDQDFVNGLAKRIRSGSIVKPY